MTKSKTPTFEQAIDDLEQIIEGIESGAVGLEASLAEYEKGMKLIKHCRAILDRAEKKIVELTADGKNGLSSDDNEDEG